MLKKRVKFNIIAFLIYFILITLIIYIKSPTRFSGSDNEYIHKLSMSINLVPFYYEPNASYNILCINVIRKITIITPFIYFYHKIINTKNIVTFISYILSIGFLIELFQLLTLKGFFDITDILNYVIYSSIIYYICNITKILITKSKMFFKQKKKESVKKYKKKNLYLNTHKPQVSEN